MKTEQDILKQIGHRDGMTVPEGYFADFAARMANSLPSTPYEESASAAAPIQKRTFWTIVRPYVYMAAMFMGVWCMLKVFTMLTVNPDQALQPTAVMAEALGNEIFVNDYIINDIDQWDVIDDLMDEGIQPTDLEILDADTADEDPNQSI